MKLRWWLLLVAAVELIGHHNLDSTTLTQDELKKRFTDIVDSFIKSIHEQVWKKRCYTASMQNVEFSHMAYKFEAHSGGLTDMSTLRRSGGLTVKPIDGKNGSASVEGVMSFTKLQLSYEYSISAPVFGKIIEGSMKTTLDDNKLRYWATFTPKKAKEGEEEKYTAKLNRVETEMTFIDTKIKNVRVIPAIIFGIGFIVGFVVANLLKRAKRVIRIAAQSEIERFLRNHEI